MNSRLFVVGICVLATLTIVSCSKESNPVQPSQPTTFIGGLGSTRTYITTERWFIPESDTPFVVVPDSLLGRITLADSLRRHGVVQQIQSTESVIPVDTAYYNSWHLPLSRDAYKMTRNVGPLYNLCEEIKQLSSNATYTLGGWQEENLWWETGNQVQSVLPVDMLTNFPALPWLKKPLSVGDFWIRYQYVRNGQVQFQKSVKVLALERVTVKGGTYLAYKLVLFWDSETPELSKEFEYYVPDIGLILYQVDRRVFITNVPAGGGGGTTIEVREVIRKELTSANVVP